VLLGKRSHRCVCILDLVLTDREAEDLRVVCSFGLLCGAGSVRQQDERHLLLLEHGQGFYGTCGDRRRGVSRGGLQVRTLAAQHRGADGAQQAYLGARGRRGRCSPRRRSRRRSCAPRRRRSAAGAALSRHGRSAAQGVWQAPAFRALQRQQRDRRTRLTVALRWIHPALGQDQTIEFCPFFARRLPRRRRRSKHPTRCWPNDFR
jgi:hypothetical protein